MAVNTYAVKKQRYNEDTPFVAWIRENPRLGSDPEHGFVRTDIDSAWLNYIFGFIMIWEDKTRMADMDGSQHATLQVIHQALLNGLRDPDFLFQNVVPKYPRPAKIYYCGFHVIKFENTGPTDGRTYIDDFPVSLEQLTRFLEFQWVPTIQVYRDLQQKLLDCKKVQMLTDMGKAIRAEVPPRHPEYHLFTQIFQQKQKEIAKQS